MFTEREVMLLSLYNKYMLHQRMLGMSFKAAFMFWRNVQVGLANYAKSHHILDEIQNKLVIVLGWIESWLRHAYYRMRMDEMMQKDPSIYKYGKQYAKTMIRQEWESLAKRSSY